MARTEFYDDRVYETKKRRDGFSRRSDAEEKIPERGDKAFSRVSDARARRRCVCRAHERLRGRRHGARFDIAAFADDKIGKRLGNTRIDRLLFFHDKRIEHGDNKERDESARRQAADDRKADRLYHLSGSFELKTHRKRTEYRRKRRHKYGTKSARPRFKTGFFHLHAAVNEEVRIVDEDDTVIDDDTDKHDDTDHRCHSHRLSRKLVDKDDADY